jgi:hypothetical protein
VISPPDPSELFRSLREANPEEEFWTGFWPSVRAGIRGAQFRTPPPRMRARAILLGSSAGLMAAAAVLVAAFLVLPATPLPGPPAARGTFDSSRPEARNESGPPPILEDLKSASARIYTFHVGGSSDSTDVILIVDESLDI